jgi:hypothetical protein
MAWGASVQPEGDASDAFAIYTEDGPELGPTIVEQRDTTPAARAKGEATRVAARAKEEKGRLGDPPPGFKPNGEREAPATEGGGQAAPAPPARATRVPPGFGEYSPNDPRYQSLTDAEQVGVRVELLDPPRTGLVNRDVVRRRDTGPSGSLLAFHADVLPAEEAEAAGGTAGGTGGGPANAPPSEEMGGRQVPDWEAEKLNNGAPTPGTATMRANMARASSSTRSRTLRCRMRGRGCRGNQRTPSTRRACSTFRTSLPLWLRALGTGSPPATETTHKGPTSCPRGRGGAMGRGSSSRSRSASASCVTWVASGSTRTPTVQMG